MTEHAGVVRITTYTTDADRWAQLIDALHRRSDEVRDAEGCFGAQVCSVEDRPDAVAVVSRWRSRNDLDSYLSSAGASVEELADGSPETAHLTSLSRE
jgi:quinol monooxygenase YgiN